jgi:hypothetical protein
VTSPDPSATSNLEARLAELAAALPDVRTSPGGAGRAWSLGGVEFAIVGPLGVELRLDPAVAAAATRTPDAEPSPRGPEWVRFNPRKLEGYDLDRLEAWFALAHRRATSTGPSG